MSKTFNAFQSAAAATYDDGEFAHCESLTDTADVGDGLFHFIVVELGEDCESRDEAIGRLERAKRQIDDVIQQL